MKISIIAAIAKNRVIGASNKLPWHFPADLAHFKKLTLNKPVIMGRKTYESIGKPLPHRINIIITTDPNYEAPNCTIVDSLQNAMKATQADEIMIIGGASIYEQTLPLATHLYLTYIDADFEGDTLFPKISRENWQEMSREEHLADEKNSFNYSFVTLIRR